jgi:uncharacterized protein (TIGR01777 family)
MTQRIAITGASGFVGRALRRHLEAAGRVVVPLVRAPADGKGNANDRGGGGVVWDPSTGAVDAALGTVDGVVHLAGESVAGGRWTAARKRAIADSRGPVTERLCRTLAALPVRPRVLVSASATGIYGDRGDEVLDERSAPGEGFLAEVARAWELATKPASDAGIRVVVLRIALVLDRDGGALPRMARPFRLGLGGRLGSGAQWTPWITRHDLVRAIAFVLDDAGVDGPVLACTPAPVTNRELTAALARVLRRPAVLPVPAFALRLLLGEMAGALLLASQRAQGTVLPRAGFVFDHPELPGALAAVLGERG